MISISLARQASSTVSSILFVLAKTPHVPPLLEASVFQQFAADGFAGTALEQHAAGHDHSGLAGGFQQGTDVLDEIELLVRGGRPEVLAVVRSGHPSPTRLPRW